MRIFNLHKIYYIILILSIIIIIALHTKVKASGPIIWFTNLGISDAPDGGLGVYSSSGRFLGDLVYQMPKSPTATPTATP
jgi:hypothetical protein